MNQPQPQSIPFSVLMNNIKTGLIKIPQFQRDFVWSKEKSAKLLDSIVKGYPIGTFILWRTRESLRTIRNLGDTSLPDTPPGDFIQYVLDGQQRLTSLYAAVKGLKIRRDERITDDFSEIYIDLTASEDEDIVIIDTDKKDANSVVRIVDLLNADLSFLASFPQQFLVKLDEYRGRFQTCLFSVIFVAEAPLDVATEIFTRINVTGRPLSVFEIMVAKTFDVRRNFDLADEYDKLMGVLKEVDYDTIPSATVLQSVSTILTKECSKKHILKLDKSKFIDVWPRVVDAIYRAVDYFRDFYRIPVSRLLPYSALLIPFTYFFYHHPDKPTGDKQRCLQDFFWRCSLGGRYSYALETKLAQDIKRIDQILAGKLPTYDYPVDTRPEFVDENGWFGTGRSYIKAILCLMAYHQPKSFIDNSIVRISNDWLKQSNSRNYHHFFPRAYLEKQGYEGWRANHIANITIVDDFLNKRQIRDKSPSRYMRDFARENDQLERTMKTHLIDLNKFGIWEDDYERFLKMRCRAIAREIKKRIIPQKIDERGQEIFDGHEEIEGFEA